MTFLERADGGGLHWKAIKVSCTTLFPIKRALLIFSRRPSSRMDSDGLRLRRKLLQIQVCNSCSSRHEAAKQSISRMKTNLWDHCHRSSWWQPEDWCCLTLFHHFASFFLFLLYFLYEFLCHRASGLPHAVINHTESCKATNDTVHFASYVKLCRFSCILTETHYSQELMLFLLSALCLDYVSVVLWFQGKLKHHILPFQTYMRFGTIADGRMGHQKGETEHKLWPLAAPGPESASRTDTAHHRGVLLYVALHSSVISGSPCTSCLTHLRAILSLSPKWHHFELTSVFISACVLGKMLQWFKKNKTNHVHGLEK